MEFHEAVFHSVYSYDDKTACIMILDKKGLKGYQVIQHLHLTYLIIMLLLKDFDYFLLGTIKVYKPFSTGFYFCGNLVKLLINEIYRGKIQPQIKASLS